MSNLSLTRVNQKLIQAKILLQGVDEESLSPVHRNSLLEAAAFHLVCAHQHYLREIAETYGLKNIIALRSEHDLITAFNAARKYPAEAQELEDLRKDPASWLSQLQAYYDSLWRIPVRPDTQESENLISLVDTESIAIPEISLSVVRAWQTDFTALVLRQRETSAEF
ncbi:hypothetical protein GCM10011613_15490 [Cellvibrio zantedeschiae]|uniref:HEPN domain-containing protein n=1 Tax=Cellvibrio zantedeschiae TaxID=1237077 RepID=A0ABQ3B2U1_9GAMM|nr:DUF6586 family protein [Cellvibrio zantedeschiae]GGY71587.1 hypothetical protein GCM10011613_15490 [Cellvibrio zantedeschiae]